MIYVIGVASVPEAATKPVTFHTVAEMAVNVSVVPINPPVVEPFIERV